MYINTATDKELEQSSNAKVSIEHRKCGDLFELRTALIPPNELTTLSFEPLINLVMVVFGSIQVETNHSTFELTVGQVWLVNGSESCSLLNLKAKQDAVVLSVLIKSTMLSLFFSRYQYDEESEKKMLTSCDDNRVKSEVEMSQIVFPTCQLTRLTLESFRLFSQQSDLGLNALKLEELLLLLLKLKGDKGQLLVKKMRNENDPIQEKFRRFMEKNATRNWQVSDYAKNIGMSLTSFKNMFGRVYGAKSPKAWINEKRLHHAQLQLKHTNKRMIDIALDSGFSSQSYFTQLYKTHYGVSPSGARR